MHTDTSPENLLTDVDVSDTHALWLFNLIYFSYRGVIREGDKILENAGLRRPHYRIMYVVQRMPGATVGDIREFLDLTQQAISPTIKTLVSKGFILTEENIEDRRSRRLFLSDEGKKVCEGVLKEQKAYVQRAYSKVGPDYAAGYARAAFAMIDDPELKKLELIWGKNTHFLDEDA